MKIERLKLEEFRRFREPLELNGLTDGINLFVGRNEAGKSTVAMALRAAFLERSRTRTVTDFASWGSSHPRPSVEVDFTVGDTAYRLKKSFLTRSRCELIVGDGQQRLDGETAEDALATLLGFDFPAKGQSQPKQAGVPGLLWIRQGEGQDVADPAEHAGTHVREALTRLSGEVASSDGDRLYARVMAERGELLDARAAKPKGIYREAEEALAAAQADVASLQAEKAQLDADVDRLAALRDEHAAMAQQQPWRQFDAQAAAARQQLNEVARARDALAALRREHATADAMLTALQTQIRRDQDDADAIARDTTQAVALAASSSAAEAAAQHARERLSQCRRASARAREVLAQAQASAERDDLGEQMARWQVSEAQLMRTLAQAVALQQQIDTGEAALAAAVTPITQADLDRLRQSNQSLAELSIRQQAAATRLQFWLDGPHGLTMRATTVADPSAPTSSISPSSSSPSEGAAAIVLSGVGERLLTDAADLDLPGIGRLRIAPGGQDLPALMAALDTQRQAHERLLARLKVRTVQEADAQWNTWQRLTRENDAARQALSILAPKGMEALRAELASGQQRQATLAARYDAQSALLQPAEGVDVGARAGANRGADPTAWTDEVSVAPAIAATSLTVPQAKSALASVERAEVEASEALAGIDARYNSEAARARLLQEQVQRATADYNDPQQQQARTQRASRLIEQRSLSEALARRADEAEQALVAQRSDLVEQDALRFERSAAIARDGHQTRHNQILTLSGKLEQAGARGVGEALMQAEADVARHTRRRDEIALRAASLDLLATLLREKRDAATLRLQAPLARRLNHYLALLFPGAQLRLGDDLLPVDLHRAGTQDALLSLSFGTREQLGLLIRLAYADLLREAGRPTLLVLDDALVHADSARRDLMKRALFDAASRHQVLMFTCHAEAWQDLGVPQRSLDR